MLWWTHARWRHQLSAYIDGQLSGRQREGLERHLSACGACQRELREIQATKAALGSLPPQEVPRSFTLRPQQVEAQPRPAGLGVPAFGLRLAATGLAAALAIVLAVDLAQLGGDGAARPVQEAAPARYGEEKEMPLAPAEVPAGTGGHPTGGRRASGCPGRGRPEPPAGRGDRPGRRPGYRYPWFCGLHSCCAEVTMNSKVMILLTLATGVLLLAAVACGDGEGAATQLPAVPSSQEVTLLQAANDLARGIAVSGEGRVSVSPDMALLNLGVSVKGATAQGAREAAAAAMTRLLDSLRANAIPDEGIQTTWFTLSPEYAYPPNGGEPRLTGYRVTHMLSVKVRNLDSVGKVIDEAVGAVGDPVQVQGISFTVTDPGSAEEQARKLAMAQARERAQQLAREAGVDLGKAIAISEVGGQLPPKVFAEVRAPAAAETPISPGQLEVVVSLQVTYAIQ